MKIQFKNCARKLRCHTSTGHPISPAPPPSAHPLPPRAELNCLPQIGRELATYVGWWHLADFSASHRSNCRATCATFPPQGHFQINKFRAHHASSSTPSTPSPSHLVRCRGGVRGPVRRQPHQHESNVEPPLGQAAVPHLGHLVGSERRRRQRTL